MEIILLGPPGAGKGTQADRLHNTLQLPHVASGDLFRENLQNQTELGNLAKGYMDKGQLVPDDVTIRMVRERLEREDCIDGVILDGFPRTVNQATELDKSLAANEMKIDFVLNLEVDDDVVAKRITGRRSCPKCGAVYHIEHLKPNTEGICDNDGTELVQRPDDTSDVVVNRLKTYHQLTEPLVDYYRNSGTVYDFDADRDVDKIKASIFEKLDTLV